jgi:hypothetical protein
MVLCLNCQLLETGDQAKNDPYPVPISTNDSEK